MFAKIANSISFRSQLCYIFKWLKTIQTCFFDAGEGGVGKSYLISTAAKWIEKILAKPGPFVHRVLLLAYTGFAASLIGKYHY